jgi:hypothetical protein
MNVQPLSSVPVNEGSRCHAHPDQLALGTCTRCGVFFCVEDRRVVDDKPYCVTCAGRPDVDYLESFRLKYWGKRDGWTWLVGFGSVFNVVSGLVLLFSGQAAQQLNALFSVGAGVVGACFWLGQSWARLAFIFVPILSMVLLVATVGPEALGLGVMPLLIAIAIYRDTRNKLFFKQEVPREKLRKAWDLYMNNTLARAGFMLGLLGVLVPGLGPIALLCSIVGLRRADPHAHPPIGRKGQAIAGIVLGAVGCLTTGLMLASFFRH